MSKELEAFGRITLHTEYDNDSNYDGIHFEDDCKLVDKALQRLEAIENVNTSEALKCLEHIKKDDFNMIITTYPPLPAYNGVTKDEMFDKIEQALLKAEKEHKALEIIKEKRVNVSTFIHFTKILKKDYEQCKANNDIVFCNICDDEKEFLTEEEFNLLKEVLE